MTQVEAGEAQVEADRQEMKKLLDEIAQGARETRKVVQALTEEMKNGSKNEGISFLRLKNSLLASYTTNLSYLMLRKCYGKGLEGEPAVERLVKDRTVLEKIRPIDQKLRYQVDKLVSIADSGTIDQNDPLRFKPNPGGLMSKLEDSDASDQEEENEDKDVSDKKFKVPMNVPQYFNEEGSKEQAEGEKKKKKALSRSMMESIKEQYLGTPEELSNKTDTMRQKYIDEERERTRIEEDNFIRLPVTKEDKLRRRQLMTMSSVGDDLTAFGKNYYDGDSAEQSAGGKKRKQFSSGGKKKGSKKFKKRRF